MKISEAWNKCREFVLKSWERPDDSTSGALTEEYLNSPEYKKKLEEDDLFFVQSIYYSWDKEYKKKD